MRTSNLTFLLWAAAATLLATTASAADFEDRVTIAQGGSPGRRGPSLGTRIFFATALLVIFAVGLAVAVTYLMGNRVGGRAARERLQRSSAVQESFQEERFEQLRLTAYLVAGDPSFSAYVAETVVSGDVLSLLDQLDERREGLGFDFALVLAPDGVVVARTDRPGATGDDFSSEAIYQQAFEGYDAGGIWTEDGQLYYAMAVPVTAAGLLEGFLIAAYAIDDRTALGLREINNTEVAFLLRA